MIAKNNPLFKEKTDHCSKYGIQLLEEQLQISKYKLPIVQSRSDKLLKVKNPSLADRIIKKYNFQFVEIAWSYKKWE